MATNQLLTVNLVLPADGNSANKSASFTRLLFDLTALALERFGAAPADHRQDALRESVSTCLAGVRVDPFDGQLLRFSRADTGYQLHGIGPELAEAPSGNDNPALTVITPLQFI